MAAKTSAQLIREQARQIAELKQQIVQRDALVNQLKAQLETKPPQGIARKVEDYNAALRQAAFDDSDASQAIATLKEYHKWPLWQATGGFGGSEGAHWASVTAPDPSTGQPVDLTEIANKISPDYQDEVGQLRHAQELHGDIIQTTGYTQFYIETERFTPSEYFGIFHVTYGADKPVDGLKYIELRGVNSPAAAAKAAM